MVMEFAEELSENIAATVSGEKTHPEEWDYEGLCNAVAAQFGFRLEIPEEERASLTQEALEEGIQEGAKKFYKQKEQEYGEDIMRYFEKMFLLSTVDALWKDHLLSMDHLKEGIGLRGYGQKDPLKEYQREGYDLFSDMIGRVKEESIKRLYTVKVQKEGENAVVNTQNQPGPRRVSLSRGDIKRAGETTQKRQGVKVGRNDPCPCGSGKKYKKCCGREA
jgi:preprotein translocase subunit SecA